MSNVNASLTVTRSDGTKFFGCSFDMPGLDDERLGRLKASFDRARKHAKATGGAGDLTVTLKANIDATLDHEEAFQADPKRLRQIQRKLVKEMEGLIDYEDEREARKAKP